MNLFLGRLCVLFLAIIGFIGGCSSEITSPKDVEIPSWGRLNELILAAVREVREGGKGPHDYVFEVPEMRRIRDYGTEELWIRMTQQSGHIMVTTAGFLCLEQAGSDHLFEAALRIVTNRQASLLFYSPVIQYLHERVEANERSFATFTAFSEQVSLDAEGIGLTVSLLPDGFAERWAATGPHSETHPVVQSVAVDAFLRQAKEAGGGLPSNVASWFDEFCDSPDSRRAIFVLHAATNDPRLKDATIAMLRDERLREMYLVLALRAKAEYIREEVSYRDLGLPQGRIDLIESALADDADSENDGR